VAIFPCPKLSDVARDAKKIILTPFFSLDEVVTDTPQQRMRFTVKPGITYLWQVCGRTEIPYEEWLALDVWYIRNRSLSLDFQILVKTIPAVASARGAY